MEIEFDTEMLEKGVETIKKLSPDLENPEKLVEEVASVVYALADFMFNTLKENESITDDDRLLLVKGFANVLFNIFINADSEKNLVMRILPRLWSRLHGIEIATLVRQWHRDGAIPKPKEAVPKWMQMYG